MLEDLTARCVRRSTLLVQIRQQRYLRILLARHYYDPKNTDCMDAASPDRHGAAI